MDETNEMHEEELHTEPLQEPVELQPPVKEKQKFHTAYEMFDMICSVVGVVLLIFMFVGRMATVNGQSMNNTLQHGEKLFMSKLFYTPDRGDIVVVDKEEGHYADELIIKRVIAKGGDKVTIDFHNWVVTVNGMPLYEPYVLRVPGPMENGDMAVSSFTVPEGCYFVMGDNRNASCDSRFAAVGFVKGSEIVGRAILRVAPFSAFGVLK